MPPAKIARLEPSMTPHSALSHYHHIITDVGTTDRTPSVSQSSVAQTTPHPTPPNPLLTDDSSDSGQPTPTHTSATPPLQSSPHPQSAVSAYHQSRVVEDVTNRHRHDLNSAISNDLVYFSNKFIGLGLISRYASDNILTKKGVGNGEKGSQLLSLVIDHFHRSHNKKNWFDDFVGVVSSEAAYEDLATSMTIETSLLEWMNAIIVETTNTAVLLRPILLIHHPIFHHNHTHIPLTGLLCHHR